jgi:hypothetical protein
VTAEGNRSYCLACILLQPAACGGSSQTLVPEWYRIRSLPPYGPRPPIPCQQRIPQTPITKKLSQSNHLSSCLSQPQQPLTCPPEVHAAICRHVAHPSRVSSASLKPQSLQNLPQSNHLSSCLSQPQQPLTCPRGTCR